MDFESRYDPRTGGWLDGGPGEIGYAAVELEVGRLIHALVRLLRPNAIIETGTHRGYSTSMIAAALIENGTGGAGGRVISFDPVAYDHLWRGSPLEALIEFRGCPSTSAEMASIPAVLDMLVLDSDHHYDTIIAELRLFEPRLRVGGHILMHDSLYFDGVGAAVQQLKADPRFEVLTLDTPRTGGDPPRRPPGITIVRKCADGPPLQVDPAKLSLHVGDPWSKPLLRGGIATGRDLG